MMTPSILKNKLAILALVLVIILAVYALVSIQKLSSVLPSSPAKGDILYWSGNSWESLPRGNAGQILVSDGDIPCWTSRISPSILNATSGNIAYLSSSDITGPVGRAATCFIAAADASARVKAQADYVCDGRNDQEEIQMTIDRLRSHKGGRIVLSEGIFYISRPINLRGAVTIQGQGMAIDDNPRQVGTSLYLADGADCSIFICDSSEAEYFCNLMDMSLNGNTTHQTFVAHDAPLINISCCADFVLERLFIRNSYGDAIRIAGTDYARLANVWVQGAGMEPSYACIRYSGGNAVSAIVNCNFSGQNGIIMEGAGDIQITNSTFYPIGQFALKFDSNDTTVQVNNSLFSSSGITVYSPNIGGNIMMSNCVVACPAAVVEMGGTHGSILLSNNDFSNAQKPVWYAKNLAPVKIDVFTGVRGTSRDYVVTAQSLNAAVPIKCALARSPDVPRNVTLSITDSDRSISAFSITASGISAATGEPLKETFTAEGGRHQAGSLAFAKIDSITVTDIKGANAGDVLDVGIGSKLGLSGVILFSEDIVKVKKNDADYLAADYAVTAAYNTIDVAPGGAIADGDDFTVWYRSSYNRWPAGQ